MTTYSFLPWLRSGVANSLVAADGDASVKVRAAMPLDLTLTGAKLDGSGDLTQNLHRDIQLYGPGDVIGIDPRAIIKVDPRNWITSFEPNYLPYVEFYDEDFPWRYTPAAADIAGHRLRPWIALVVLEEGVEFEDGKDLTGKKLPYITLKAGISAADVFPRPDELWAWAHVHANTDLSSSGGALSDVLGALDATLRSNPDHAYARIMCPRRLKPGSAYHAFLIPTFETGRLAGLGRDIPPDTVATASAWDSGQNEFPHYHRWFFKAGPFGDFEYLVKLLQPKPVDSRVGVRDIDVLHPGSALPPIDNPTLGGVLKLGGALRPPFATLPPDQQVVVTRYDQWDVPRPHAFSRGVADLVNLADDYARQAPSDVNPDGDPDPVVTLPLYGRWHALTDRLLRAADGTPLPFDDNWVHRLNLDPRFRTAGGLGTGVVQKNDQKLMNGAWQQIGDVLAANARLRFAQLALAIANAMHARHLAVLAPEQLVMTTAPLHARVLAGTRTVTAMLRASVVPPAITSGVFRRIARPGTALAKRLKLPRKVAARIVKGIAEGTLRPAPPKTAPTGGITTGPASRTVRPAGMPDWVQRTLARWPWLRLVVIVLLLILALFALLSGPLGWIALFLLARLALRLVELLSQWTHAAVAEESIAEERQTPAAVDRLPTIGNFVITRPGVAFTPTPAATDSAEGVRFKGALRDVYRMTSVAFDRPAKQRVELATLGRDVAQAIHPRLTIPRRIKQIVHLPGRISDGMVEQFTPCMAYPVFDMPMYKPLADISADLFLPNINLIEQNSITLLETNQRFIESYMVGLNHEMARELLWNEYPTDQRGSYFRQFWDVNAVLPAEPTPVDREALRDIPELHRWSRMSALGTHNQRATGNLLVLVIRGELLKRYPTAVIYAHKSQWPANPSDPNAERELVPLTPSEEAAPPRSKIRMPLFEAKVDPDIYFIGFDLGALEARGGTTPTSDPGWFFVIKERPGEPRFGLDDVPEGTTPRTVTWNDLSWIKVGTAPGAHMRLTGSIALDPYNAGIDQENKPDPDDVQAQWNPSIDAAELAYILYRVPVLVAVHASRMLP